MTLLIQDYEITTDIDVDDEYVFDHTINNLAEFAVWIKEAPGNNSYKQVVIEFIREMEIYYNAEFATDLNRCIANLEEEVERLKEIME